MNNKLIRVLLVDDDEDDYFLTREYFQDLVNWKFDITWCATFREAEAQIRNNKFDLYLFDYLLGENTGIDLIELACNFECEEPIILLTGKGDTKIAVEALRLGAADYLIKSELDAEKLERSIRYALERTSVLKALRTASAATAGFLKNPTISCLSAIWKAISSILTKLRVSLPAIRANS